MAIRARRGGGNGLEAWPGYVDALSTLLMVIIFVLLVFVLAQAFLSVSLSGRDQALERVNRQLSELSDMLSLERGRTSELQVSVAQLNRDLQSVTAARDLLAQQLAAVRGDAEKAVSDRDALQAERDRLAAQLADANLQARSAAAQNEQLRTQLGEAAARSDRAGQETTVVAGQLADTKKQLAALQARLAEMERQSAEQDRIVKADKATIEARLSDLAKLAEQARALTALRDELEKQAQDAAARATTEQQRRQAVEAQLADEKKLGDSARAQLALLSRQVDELKTQLARISKDLDLAEGAMRDKDVQIANLGQRLNAALAAKVEELQRYRSEFFGKLREVLANRPGIQVVGDRIRVSERGAVPGRQRRNDAGRSRPDQNARRHDQADRRTNPAQHPLDLARGRTRGQATDRSWQFRLELGAVGRARDHGGQAADRRGRAGESSRRDRIRRFPAA